MSTSTTTPELFPHQREGSLWLCRTKRGGLFDEQGLGKTATAIHAADTLGLQRVLILAPTVVAYNWQREIATWAGGKVQVVTASRITIDPAARWVVVTHGLAIKESVQKDIAAKAWDVVVLDEAHFFRNPTAQRTKAFYGLSNRPGAPNLVACADRVWLLTGTPMPNDPTELWAMLVGLAPERICMPGTRKPMTWKQFRNRFCKLAPSPYDPDGVKVVGAANSTELRMRMKGFAMRRLKRDHLNLPPLRYGVLSVTVEDLPAELLALGDAIGQPDPGNVDAWLAALRDHEEFARYRRLCGLAKAKAAAELISQELSDGAMKKVVVFAHHRDVIDHLSIVLRPHAVVTITGDTPAESRQMAVERFQNTTARVALCQIQAGGVGITLTAASDVIFVEQSFVPGENAQAADRVHRIGQTSSVLVRMIALANSVDEIVATVLARKTSMIREVMS